MDCISNTAEIYLPEKTQKTDKVIQLIRTFDVNLIKKLFKTEEKFIPTLNNTGFMSTQLDLFSQEFINFSKNRQGKVLEVGTAYGICALTALSQGISITCNDIDKQHLAVLRDIAVKCGCDTNLSLVPGAFPNQINFQQDTFDAILISRVLHLFDGNTIQRSLLAAKEWLKPNGKLFIVADTPYLKNLLPFIPIYEERVRNKEKWPGLLQIDKNSKLITNLSSEWPMLANFLDVDVLYRELTNIGFNIEVLHTISRSDFPADRVLDGREGVGAIAVKSSD